MRNHYCEKEKEGSGLKKTTILIIAFSVCILLFATYFIISSLPEKNNGQDYEEESAYLYVDQTDVESVIGFSFIGGEYDLSFEKDKDGCWKYTKNLSLPVNGELIDRLLSDYELFLATKLISDHITEASLSEYGVDAPSYTLTLRLKNETKTYLFGDPIESKGLYYAMEKGSHSIYLVEKKYAEIFSLDLSALLTPDSFPKISESDILHVTLVCGKYSEKIIPDGTSDSGESKFISALCSISPDEFVDFGSENFKTYGLLEDDAVNVYITFSSKDKICTTALKFGLGETKEFNYLLIGDTLEADTEVDHSFSEMIYLLSPSENDVIYGFISKAFSGK